MITNLTFFKIKICSLRLSISPSESEERLDVLSYSVEARLELLASRTVVKFGLAWGREPRSSSVELLCILRERSERVVRFASLLGFSVSADGLFGRVL